MNIKDAAEMLAMVGINAGVSYLNGRMLNIHNPKGAAIYGAAATAATIGIGTLIINNSLDGTKDLVGPMLKSSNPVIAGFGVVVGLGDVLKAAIVGAVGGLVSGIFLGKAAAHMSGNPLSGKEVGLLTGVYALEAASVIGYFANKK